MNNKKNKKQRGGFVDMTNPMVIGVIVISEKIKKKKTYGIIANMGIFVILVT